MNIFKKRHALAEYADKSAEQRYATYIDDLIEFTHSAVEEARKEMEREIRGMKEGKIDIVKLKAEGIVDLQSWAEGYDQALQDVINLLSHKKLYEKKTT